MERRELTFRVFVSSTFSDLKAERDALQRDSSRGCANTARNTGAGSRRWTCAGVSARRLCVMDEGRGATINAKMAARLRRRHGWLIIGLLWIVALILAFIGFGRNAIATGRPAASLFSSWPPEPRSARYWASFATAGRSSARASGATM
jgi:hypothetical protein